MTNSRNHWQTIDTKHFSIHYYKEEEAVARRLAGIAEEVYGILSESFQAFPKGRTQVVVTDENDDANGFATVIPYNLVWIRVAPPDVGSSLGDFDDWLRLLFMHEFTHVIHISDTGYPAKVLKSVIGKIVAPNAVSPGWVTEGFAAYFETSKTTGGRAHSSFTEMMLRTDILKNQFLPIDQMAGTQYEWPNWMAQYHYGSAFWEFIAHKYGEKSLATFSHKYGSSLLFFMLNHQAKKSFEGKDFYKLWKEWKELLTEKYQEQKTRIEKEGVREGAVFLQAKKDESYVKPAVSKDGKFLIAMKSSLHRPRVTILKNLETGEEKEILKKKKMDALTLSPYGDKVLYAMMDRYKWYNHFSDLYEYDIVTKKDKKLTEGKRARDPEYSPDGKKIVAVLNELGKTSLGVLDIEKKSWEVLGEAQQMDHPAWMPSGEAIVVSAHRGGQRDLWRVSVHSKEWRRLTNNRALETHPQVRDQNGHEVVYYSSDVSGIPNIYSLSEGASPRQISNVLTGALHPSVASDGSVYFQYYHGKGYEIHKISPSVSFGKAEDLSDVASRTSLGSQKERFAKRLRTSDSPEREVPQALPGNTEGDIEFKAHKYHPWKSLLVPRYWMPSLALADGAIFASGAIDSTDPLYRHHWYAGVSYRGDNNFVGYFGGYDYLRYRMPISVSGSLYAVNFGDVFGVGQNYFEKRARGAFSIAYPFEKHTISGGYFFEDRSIESGVPIGSTLTTLGQFAGVGLHYHYGTTSQTAAAISPESGKTLGLNVEMTNHFLGSSNNLEQKIFWGDARTYLKVPGTDHQVIALRAAGGAAFGDRLLQGNFSLGGALGESLFNISSTRLFTLRGLPISTFSRDRAWVASAEYRFPLFRVQRGLGTTPFALNSAHMAFFADVGDAYRRDNPAFKPLLGIGAELRADFVLAYHLPVMGRLGYGVIVTNRDRITGAVDDITGQDARNGVFILEFGTSY